MNKIKKYIKNGIVATISTISLMFFTVGLITLNLLFLIPSVFFGTICIQIIIDEVDNNE